MKKQTPDSQKRAEIIKSMERVVALPSGSPKRWRAAYKHFLRQKPEAVQIAKDAANWVAEQRKESDKFASTKNGRMAFGTPPFLMSVLRNTDPEYFLSHSSKDFSELPHLKKMKQAFPEFFYAEVI